MTVGLGYYTDDTSINWKNFIRGTFSPYFKWSATDKLTSDSILTALH